MHECRAAKVYSGNRGRYSNSVEVRERRSMRTRPLELRLDPFNHSPTGLEWGYGGSGPAHLALAILADHLGDDTAAANFNRARWLLSWGAIDRGLSERGAFLTQPESALFLGIRPEAAQPRVCGIVYDQFAIGRFNSVRQFAGSGLD
jgi:hypothetical protein